MSDADLKKILAAAESTVAGIKDPELKRPAFEKILEWLLAEGRPATGRATTKRSPKGEQPEPEDDDEHDTREGILGAYNHAAPPTMCA